MDKALKQLESNIENMMDEFFKMGRKLHRQLDDILLIYQKEKNIPSANNQNSSRINISAESDTTNTAQNNNSMKSGMNDVREVDRHLGTLYGCIELRDAIKEAQSRMDAFEEVVKRVEKYVHNPFVTTQLENLFQSIKSLHMLFNRMVVNMQTIECESFFEELSDVKSHKSN